jgi:hypothetical protein
MSDKKDKRKCSCSVCRRHRWLKEVCGKKDPVEMEDAINKLEAMLSHEEGENEWRALILKGVWPSSVKMLSHALRRAIEHEEKRK